MDYFSIIIPKMCGFLMLVLIGYGAGKAGIIKKESMSSLSGFLIKIILPALTVSLIWENNTTFFSIAEYGRIVICQVLVYFLLAGTGIFASRFLPVTGKTENVFRGCMVGGNYGFVVIPLIMALFSETGGTKYIPICSVVDTTMVWTLGFLLFTRGVGERESTWKKILLNPIFISIILGLVLTTFQIPVPAPVMDTVTSLGSTSYSWGLMYLGCSLSFLKRENLKGAWCIGVQAFLKLLAVPAVVYLVGSRFLPQVEALILMLIAAAPSMTTSTMIAKQYHLDEEYASAAVAVTTLACMVTIPLLFLTIVQV